MTNPLTDILERLEQNAAATRELSDQERKLREQSAVLSTDRHGLARELAGLTRMLADCLTPVGRGAASDGQGD